jgi:hypothetical protein
MKLSAEQRRALAMLAGTALRGATEAIMTAHFGVELLAGLVREGWASVDVQSARAGGKAIKVVRMRITDAGRRALGVA